MTAGQEAPNARMGGCAKCPRKILAYGFKLSENFGGPSVLHGLRAALGRLCPETALVCYQPTPVVPVSVCDMDFPVREYPYGKNVKRFLKDWLKVKFLRKFPASAAQRGFWEDYLSSDVVVNIYAICFCENWGTAAPAEPDRRPSLKKCLKSLMVSYLPNLVARIDGKTSVKSTSSYGAILTAGGRLKARLAAKWFFKRIVAREKESARQMRELSGVRKEIPVAPDLANLMPAGVVARRDGVVGIAPSFQMERKWGGGKEGYVECMAALVDHVRAKYGCRVLLLPNQMNGPNGRGDGEVARDIVAALEGRPSGWVEVFDTANEGSIALKRAIAGCEAVVSPRYHTCVAALSAGVPLLTVGWHYKYTELMELYGQSGFVMPSEECTVESLLAAFDRLWAERGAIRRDLEERGKTVADRVLDSVRFMCGLQSKRAGMEV